MPRVLPRVNGELLHLPDSARGSIRVGSPEWYAWLEEHHTFVFISLEGRFTARKERGRPSGWYWKAYRWCAGKLRTAYLGRSQDLTLARLQAAARRLAVVEGQPGTAKLLPYPGGATASPLGAFPQTKFFPPPRHPYYIPRPRLLNRLRKDSQPVILISAPAGYGKTTLLTDWIATDKRIAAWLSLDESDNDPVRFLTALVIALETIQPGVGKRIRSLLCTASPPPIIGVLPVLLNDLTARLVGDARGRPVLLVLDDYHVITSPHIHTAVEMLLERRPPCIRLVIVSRADPPLPLARLRVRDELVEIRATELAFTLDETTVFLQKQIPSSPDPKAIAALVARTEGWIAAIQLAARSLQSCTDQIAFITGLNGSDHQIFRYLVDEVLARQSDEVQSFLLHTSILNRMCAELCDAVLNRRIDRAPAASNATASLFAPIYSSQAMLEYLEASNLFVTLLDEARRWYRYHPLFAEALRHQLRVVNPTLETLLRRRASAWYEREGYIIEAIEQALAGKDWERAAQLIETIADVLCRRGEFTILEGWINMLPADVVRERPQLKVRHAYLLACRGQPDAVEPMLQEVEHALASRALPPPKDHGIDTPLPITALQGQIAAIRIQIARQTGDLVRARSMAEYALAQLPADDDWRASVIHDLAILSYWSDDLDGAWQYFTEAATLAQATGNYYQALSTYNARAFVQINFGHLSKADDLLAEARHLAATWHLQDLPINAHNDKLLAWIRYQRNDLLDAESALRRGIERAHQGRLWELLGYLWIQMARLRLAQGDLENALHACDQADAAFTPLTSGTISPAAIPWRQAHVMACRARIQMAQGNLQAAEHSTRHAESLVMTARGPATGWLCRIVLLDLAHVYLLAGDAPTTLDMLAPLRARAQAVHAHDHLIEILILQALAFERLGHHAQALDALARALELGEPEGYVRPFLDAGAQTAELIRATLRVLNRAPTTRPDLLLYIRYVLDAFSKSSDIHYTYPPLIEQLTVRELEILRLISEGYSNEEIARTLIISINTVKWHIKAIYGKLSARRRTHAVAQARRLGLIAG